MTAQRLAVQISTIWRPRSTSYLLIVCIALLLPLLWAGTDAQPNQQLLDLVSGLRVRTVASNIFAIADSCNIDERRALIVSKLGSVFLWNRGRLTRLMDLQRVRKLNTAMESGLVSCLATEETIWLFYTQHDNQVISTWGFNGTQIDSASESVLLRIPVVTKYYMHVASGMQWSNDRKSIWVTVGDQAACDSSKDLDICANVQSPNSYMGKVLRIDLDGKGLPTNPYWNGIPNSVRSRVWAMGFRNPWSLATIPGSNDVLVFDVGMGTREAIKRIKRGTQGGWPCFEGTLNRTRRGMNWQALAGKLPFNCGRTTEERQSAVVVYEWDHNRTGSAIIGGAFASSKYFGSVLAGKVVFCDYVRGTVYAANRDLSSVEIIARSIGVSKIKVGPTGRLWVMNMLSRRIEEIYDPRIAPEDLLDPTRPKRGCEGISGIRSIANTYFQQETPASSQELGWICVANGRRWPCVSDGRMTTKRGESRPMTIGGRRFSTGFGVRGLSRISIPLDGRCESFSTAFGLDDFGTSPFVRSVFRIRVDGRRVFLSDQIKRGRVYWARNISLIGAQKLELVTKQTVQGAINSVWGDPLLRCGPSAPLLPRTTFMATNLNGKYVKPGWSVSFFGTATSANGTVLPPKTYVWELGIRHCQGSLCHFHPSQLVVTGKNTATFQLPDHEDCIWYDVTLRVTDSCGRTGSSTRSFLVRSKEPLCRSGMTSGIVPSLVSNLNPDVDHGEVSANPFRHGPTNGITTHPDGDLRIQAFTSL